MNNILDIKLNNHTIHIKNAYLAEPKNLELNIENKVIVPLINITNETKNFSSVKDKLSFVCTIAYIKDGYRNVEMLKKNSSWKRFENDLIDYCNLYGLKINGVVFTNLEEARIDTDNFYNYSSIEYFPLDPLAFIFNNNVCLEIG